MREAGKAKVGPLAVVAAIVVVLVAVGVFVAAGGDGIDTDSSGGDGAATATSTEVRALPQFTADLRGGGSLESADIEGPALIQVYASWCPTCQAHAPDVAKLQEQYDGELAVYYLNVADEAGPAQSFIDQYGWADGPVLVDDDRQVEGAFGLTGQPHSIFVDGDGNVVDIVQGGGSLEQLRDGAEQALA